MPDIFDQVAPDTAAPAAGDIFDRIAAPKLSSKPEGNFAKSEGNSSDSLPQPDQVEQHATMAARQAVDAATRPRPGIGDLFHAGRAVLGAGLDTFRSGMQTPLVDVDRMIPESVGPGVARGAADVASGLTTPSNLMMLAGFPEGVAGKLLGLGFSAQQLVDAAHEVPGFTDAVRAKDYGRARQIATHAVLSTLLAAMAAKHGRAAEPAAPEATPTMVRDARGGDIFDRVAKEQPNVPQSPPGHGAAAAEEKRQSASAAGPVPVAGPQPAGEPGPAAEPSRAPAAAAPSAPVTFRTEPAGAAAETVGEPRLPRALAGAKPRYNYGAKRFTIEFESDLDKAAYITAQDKRSASDQKFVDFVSQHTGLADREIRPKGAVIRSTIKGLAKDAEPGVLKVPSHRELWGKASQPRQPAEPSRAPAAAAPSAPVTFRTEPAGAAAETVPDGKPHEYFRGDWNIPLNETGRQQVAAAAGRNPGQFDEIYSGTKDRHRETAAEFLRTNPQAGQVKADPAFDPMHLGMHEGEEVTPERLADLNDRLRNRPDEPIPGVGKFSGSPGERPRDWSRRLLGKLQQIAADWKPGERKLIVTSGRDVQAVRAWAARGMPADRSVDPDILTSRWRTEPGQMLRLDPRTGKLEDVDHATEDGIYFARHGETDGNANPAIPEDVRNQSYDKYSTTAGPIGSVLDRAAERLADGEEATAVKQDAYRQIRTALLAEADKLSGVPAGNGGGAEGSGAEGPRPTGTGEPAQPAAAEVTGVSDRLESQAQAAMERIRKRGTLSGRRMNAGLPVDDLADLTIWGAAKIAKGVVDFAEWSRQMAAEFGEQLRPHLEDLYRRAVDYRGSLFGAEAEERSQADAKQYQDRLQGDRLTAQFRSGTAAKPAKTKPAQNRGLFEEPAPEQDSLFGAGTTMHGGLPLDVVGAIFRADLKEMREMKARRDAALAALEQSKETPEDKAFGQKVISYFTGERDLWAARVNQVMARLRKLVPDTVEQEALSLMRDFKGREQELTQFLQGTHPALHDLDQDQPLLRGGPGSAYAKAMEQIEKLRPAILKALNPTARMLEADAALTKIAAGTLREGQRLEFLDSRWTPEQYNPHILHRKGEGELPEPNRDRWGKSLGGKIGKYFGFAERREFPSLLDAIAQGYRPKTLNAFDAFTIHGDRFATARATRLLENQLRDTGIGVYAAQGKAPRGWVRLAPHSNEFRKLVPFLREGQAVGSTDAARQVAERKLAGMREGKSYEDVSREESARIAEEGGGNAVVPDVAELGLWVPEYIEKALRPITEPDYLGRIPAFKFTRHAQAYQKAVQLGLSFFHATSENYMALANMGPRGWLKALRADRLDPEFEKAERDFIAHGGTSSIQGRTVEAYKSLQPGTIPSWGEIWRKAPVIHQADQLAGQITEFTFGKLQRQFKVTDFQLHAAAWLAEHPNATPAEANAAKASIAKEINAVYGGLNTELLGVNRATTEMARALLLAPDWTFSNIFNVRYSLERGTEAGKLARLFWIRQMAGGMIATQLLSLALAHKPSPNPTQVYFGKDKDGQDVYQNVFFKGAAGDVINLAHNVWDYGAVSGLARTMSAKSAGFARAGMQLMTNRDYLGHTIVSPELNPIAGTVRGAWKLGESLAPVPFSVTNLKDMLIGPHADEYTVPEFLTTPFSGNPPRHIPPPGFRMGPEGLEEKDEEERQRNSLWRQIVTGQAYAGRNQ